MYIFCIFSHLWMNFPPFPLSSLALCFFHRQWNRSTALKAIQSSLKEVPHSWGRFFCATDISPFPIDRGGKYLTQEKCSNLDICLGHNTLKVASFASLVVITVSDYFQLVGLDFSGSFICLCQAKWLLLQEHGKPLNWDTLAKCFPMYSPSSQVVFPGKAGRLGFHKQIWKGQSHINWRKYFLFWSLACA